MEAPGGRSLQCVPRPPPPPIAPAPPTHTHISLALTCPWISSKVRMSIHARIVSGGKIASHTTHRVTRRISSHLHNKSRGKKIEEKTLNSLMLAICSSRGGRVLIPFQTIDTHRLCAAQKKHQLLYHSSPLICCNGLFISVISRNVLLLSDSSRLGPLISTVSRNGCFRFTTEMLLLRAEQVQTHA